MIIRKFKEQVKKTPNKLAVKSIDEGYTYLLLDKYSSKISSQLTSRVNNQDPVPVIGLLFEHGVDMILSMLGALKAGFIYVPLSPKYPQKRLQYMIEHSGASVIVTNTLNVDTATSLFENSDKIINIDDKTSYNNELINRVNDEAYIIYTSGSTGKPKGVIQTQKNIYYYCKNWANLFNIDSSDNLTLFSSFFHDGSVQDIFTSLLFGATLYPYDVMNRDDSVNFENFLLKENITIWHSVPSLYSYFLNTLKKPVNNSSLKYILLGGEAIRKYEIEASSKFFKDVPMVSIYGQTESSVNTICILNGKNKITLGKTLSETKIFLVDENNEMVEPLSTGEIIIASDYISAGYWNVESDDSSPFIDSPALGKLYKTGDIGRLLVNGDVEFLGRKDNQIKIRGFRIELGEIENVLLNHEGVKECVVLAREEKEEMFLCAYVVLWQKQKQEDLRSYLIGLLPDYMIPSYFVELDKLPLTANGKINRLALPVPEIKAGASYVAPKSIIEIKLVKIWSEVLKLPSKEISTNVSFFELGGHSLKATVLVSLIHKELEVRIELRDVFQYRTIQGQAELIELSERSSYFSIPKAKKQEYYSLSSAQRRLYLLQQMELGSIAYNMPGLIPISKGQDKQQIRDVFKKLIARHENFRTSFEVKDELPVQRIHDEVSFIIKEYQITKAEISGVYKDFVQAFNLSQAPLLRVGYFEISDGDDMLLVDMHHIISDGKSHEILEKDFNQLLEGKDLEPLQLQYKDFSEWQNSSEQQERIKGQESYWLDKYSDEIPILDLPTDYPRPAIQEHEGASLRFVLSKEETENIRAFAKENDTTLYMSVLSIFTLLLSKLSGQKDIIVGSPIVDRVHSDLENIVGIFLNTLAIRNDVKEDDTVKEFVARLRQSVLGAFENKEYQFEELVENISIGRDLSRNPLIDVMFNLLNHTDFRKDQEI
ncbi:MAG: amino acid adenylation domain-containing protein, partial [Bacteroidales bacterium]|nr:amino acid adenylation domain-containing protein [Bacteroidales bacterium]